ncbi:MAG: hypothetical protein NC133_00835 [Prevotella sp.]|nr:hypothetical protein [Prevotella sp.]
MATCSAGFSVAAVVTTPASQLTAVNASAKTNVKTAANIVKKNANVAKNALNVSAKRKKNRRLVKNRNKTTVATIAAVKFTKA